MWPARPRRLHESPTFKIDSVAGPTLWAARPRRLPESTNLRENTTARAPRHDLVAGEAQKTPRRPILAENPIAGAPGTDVVAGKAQKTPRELKPCRDHDGEGPKTQRCGRRGLENSARAPNLAVNTPRERRGPTLQPVRSRKTPQEPKSSNSFDGERVDARLPRRRGSRTYSRA